MWFTYDCNFFVKLSSVIVLVTAIVFNGIGNLLGVGDIIETEPYYSSVSTAENQYFSDETEEELLPEAENRHRILPDAVSSSQEVSLENEILLYFKREFRELINDFLKTFGIRNASMATGVKLNKKSLKVSVGSFVMLQAEILPSDAKNPNIRFESDNPAVASVNSNGVIRGEREGTTTVYAIAEDGGFYSACAVTVTKASVLCKSVVLSASDISVNVGSTENVSVSVTPQNTTDKLSVIVSDSDTVSAVLSNKVLYVKGKSVGKATVTVKCGDVYATLNVTVKEKIYVSQPQVVVYDDVCSILVVPPVVEGYEVALKIVPEAQYMDMGNGLQGFIGVTPGETYSITACCVVDGAEESSEPVVVTVYDPVTPAEPVIKSVTHNSVTVEYDARCEYRLISATYGIVSDWSDKSHYENLTPDTAHSIEARYKTTDTHASSNEENNKASASFRTLEEPTTAPQTTSAPATTVQTTTKPSTTKKTTASTTKAPTTEKGPYLNTATEVALAIFGGNSGNVGTVIRGIDALADGGYVACGTTASTDGDFAGLYSNSSNWKSPFSFVAKFSRAGTVEWVKLFGDSTFSVSINDIAVLDNGNIVAVGTYTQPSVYGEKGGNDAVIITLSSAGAEISRNIQSGSGDDFFYCVTATPTGYAVGGKTTSHDGDFAGVQDISAIVINFNNDNEVLWKHYFNGTKSSSINGIDADDDGNIFIACVTTATDGQFASFAGLFGSYSDTIVMKYNQAGEFQWSYIIATSGTDNFDSVAADGKGGCLVAGNYTMNSATSPDGTLEGIHNCGDTDALAIRLNKNGDRQWYKIVSGFYDDYITDVVRTDGGFALTGYTNSSNREFASIGNQGGTDGFIYFLDVNGTTVKVLSQAGFDDDAALCLAYSSGNRELLIAGSTDSTNGSFADKNNYSGTVGYVGRYKITTRNY